MDEVLAYDFCEHSLTLILLFILVLSEFRCIKLSLLLHKAKANALVLNSCAIIIWLCILSLPICSEIFHLFYNHTYFGTLWPLRCLSGLAVLASLFVNSKAIGYKYLLILAVLLTCLHNLEIYTFVLSLVFLIYRALAQQTKWQQEYALLENEKRKIQTLLLKLEDTHKEETAHNLHSDLHDLMGRNLATIQQLLESKQVDYSKLRQLLNSLTDDVPAVPLQSASIYLTGLLKTYKTIGLDVKLEGQLPSNEKLAQIFVKFISEAVNNALRHGKATQVKINISKGPHPDIIIRDNGTNKPEALVLGKGLQGLTKDLARVGYSLEIQKSPEFTLIGRFDDND